MVSIAVTSVPFLKICLVELQQLPRNWIGISNDFLWRGCSNLSGLSGRIPVLYWLLFERDGMNIVPSEDGADQEEGLGDINSVASSGDGCFPEANCFTGKVQCF
jgi:hypothetical protein